MNMERKIVWMIDFSRFNLQYITDESGKKTAVVFPIQEFRELLEDLEDLAIAAQRQDEPTISHELVIAELKRDGLLPD